MRISNLTPEDSEGASALWDQAGLTRPWNPPEADLLRALAGETSTVLGLFDGGTLVGTVMVGHDGHRGWVYYLAVAESHRGTGLGRRLMLAAEDWLRERGVVKLQLMVRSANAGVLDFYDRLGYEDADVQVRAKWLR
ncbi:GNAT family acetyltransferase [Cryobacterium zhongshanensis]|uniref:GNAT family acetyltransferase n=1 Tax=Cryobacterium zhongshanensis TaxID=2928153 RepID=A0AA41QX46_9MICO|nr:GNAT family acetyltransferase [Cryobacterium zhongshanensis]MCI4659357.1 GNAT family acetyltransferase [Cryobacterium zhongshanensis]